MGFASRTAVRTSKLPTFGGGTAGLAAPAGPFGDLNGDSLDDDACVGVIGVFGVFGDDGADESSAPAVSDEDAPEFARSSVGLPMPPGDASFFGDPPRARPRASARCRFASSSATACLSHAARTTARSTSSTFTFSFRRCFAVKCATPKASSHMALRCSYGAMVLCLLSNACVYTGSTHTSSNIRRKCDTIVACPPSPVGGLAESP